MHDPTTLPSVHYTCSCQIFLTVTLNQVRCAVATPVLSISVYVSPNVIVRYKNNKYGGSEEQMKKYETVMGAEGMESGIPFRFDGTIANTQHAHRVIQYFQEEIGPEAADKIVTDLYGQYFTQAKHPSSHETLLHAVLAAGIPEGEAKRVVEDESEGMMEMKMLEREQRGNGIDAVPYITLEGKRRDLTIQGARSVVEFEKELHQIAKEAK